MSRVVAVTILCAVMPVGLAAELRFPVPPGAQEARHFRLADSGGEQDYFLMTQSFPSVGVLEHYRKVFSKWVECKPNSDGWQSFGDVSGRHPRFVHQLLRQWVSPGNRSVVTLALSYYSEGSQFRARPDNDTLRVVVIEHNVPNGRGFAEQLGYKCVNERSDR